MPIYEYQCDSCGVQFERRQSFADNSTPVCPNGHAVVHRVYSVPGVVFKGSGWYVTDSRKSDTKGSSD
ncbi:MAG: hypothetical protein KDI55_09080 [Anaerolineae bacterium]|nr:hypothetical protein [Anaerolineae bacterium]